MDIRRLRFGPQRTITRPDLPSGIEAQVSSAVAETFWRLTRFCRIPSGVLTQEDKFNGLKVTLSAWLPPQSKREYARRLLQTLRQTAILEYQVLGSSFEQGSLLVKAAAASPS